MIEQLLQWVIEHPIEVLEGVLAAIGGATLLFRVIAPMTETKKDDKILAILTTILERVALNRDTNKLEIKLKNK